MACQTPIPSASSQSRAKHHQVSVYYTSVTITQNHAELLSAVLVSQMCQGLLLSLAKHRSRSSRWLWRRTGRRTHWRYTALSFSHGFVVVLHRHRSTSQHLVNIVHRHRRHCNANINCHGSFNQHTTQMFFKKWARQYAEFIISSTQQVISEMKVFRQSIALVLATKLTSHINNTVTVTQIKWT